MSKFVLEQFYVNITKTIFANSNKSSYLHIYKTLNIIISKCQQLCNSKITETHEIKASRCQANSDELHLNSTWVLQSFNITFP